MGVGATMQSLAEILSSDSGSLVLGIAALVAIAAPFIDRYFIRRRRLTFRVLYNSKIGLPRSTCTTARTAARRRIRSWNAPRGC